METWEHRFLSQQDLRCPSGEIGENQGCEEGLVALQSLDTTSNACSLLSPKACSVPPGATVGCTRCRAAVLALSSLSMHCKRQEQADRILMFLGKHSKQISSIQLTEEDYRTPAALRQLPLGLHPSTLKHTGFDLQLQPGNGFPGVLGPAARLVALKQLELKLFKLLDGDEGLAAALTQSPAGLERLCIAQEDDCSYINPTLSTSALQHLQQLTYLKTRQRQLCGLCQVWPHPAGHDTAGRLASSSRMCSRWRPFIHIDCWSAVPRLQPDASSFVRQG